MPAIRRKERNGPGITTVFTGVGGGVPSSAASKKNDEPACSGWPARAIEPEHTHRKPVAKTANHRKGAPMTEHPVRIFGNGTAYTALPFIRNSEDDIMLKSG